MQNVQLYSATEIINAIGDRAFDKAINRQSQQCGIISWFPTNFQNPIDMHVFNQQNNPPFIVAIEKR